jgi:DNA-binding response OmpR family regulator
MKKILLIENDVMIMEYTSDFLKKEGFNVYTSSNSRDGIRIATNIIPDAIVSDINMPDANEFELCKAMRSTPLTSQIPVIFITERPQDIQRGMQIGADDFLPKPFSLTQLIKTINNIFRNQPELSPVYAKI